jgi:hypothetical protein
MVVSQIFYRTTSILRSRPASWTPPLGPGRRPPAPQDARPGSPPAGLAALGSRPPASPRPGTALPPAATAGLRRGPPPVGAGDHDHHDRHGGPRRGSGATPGSTPRHEGHRRVRRCIRGCPSAPSSTTGPREPPAYSSSPVGDEGRVRPRRPVRVPGRTGRASRTAVPLPGTTVPESGSTGLDPRACRYRRRAPRYRQVRAAVPAG